MTLKERVRYLTDGLAVASPGLSLQDLGQRMPDIAAGRLKRCVRTMIEVGQLTVRADRQHVYRMLSGPKPVRVMRTEPEKAAQRVADEKYNNGTQQLVLEAIQAGNELVGDIMHATGLEELTVRNHVRRLMQALKVQRAPGDGPARYVATGRTCLLARVWTGVRPIARQPEARAV